MARTQARGTQILDASITKDDIDIVTSGKALITRLSIADFISMSSTGADTGTGVVSLSINRSAFDTYVGGSVLSGYTIGSNTTISATDTHLTAFGKLQAQINAGGGSTVGRTIQTFTATAGQTTFTISGGYTVNNLDIFLNGVRLNPTEYSASNGTTVVLLDACAVNDILNVIIFVASGFSYDSIRNIQTVVTANYSVDTRDSLILVNGAVDSVIDINLFDANAAAVFTYKIKNIGLGKVNINAFSGQTIDDESQWQILFKNTVLTIVPYNGNWLRV